MREMKDSGVEWIGEIPKDWKVSRLKYVLSEAMKYGANETGVEYSSEMPRYIRITDISLDGKLKDTGKLSLPNNVAKEYILKDKAILFARSGATVGKTFIYKSEYGKMAFAGYLISAYCNEKLFSPELLYYFTNSFAYSEWINRVFSQSTIQNIGADKYVNMILAVPKIAEQQQIVDYLDTKCSEIDATTEDIQKEISLLEDYKKSVITEAVTKGLDPDAEMKDSGIAWIGEVPKHWGTIRIGNAFSIRNERNYLPMEQVQLLSLYSGKGVFPTGEEETTNRGNHAQTVADYKIVKKNDIVVNIILAWMGSLGISNYNGVVSPAYDVYIPNEEKVVPHYYHYVFRTSGIANECYRYGRGIMMMRWRTYSSEFKRIHVPFPPLEEQQQIADFLDTKCSEIDAIIADKKHQRGILADYKKSLIYEYVTGKKEVPVHE